ncbi:4-hydroxythreonine-4-phosphate dehydrogenase PdxA [Legionella sp. km772]|uniref:4-hydroxythreonine-4-phosphate dehydrogenase PdxA n=1 Tax=Legionella sp. km772 TaxID=2498111 RepID=UPI000F8E9E79|nr:4-hydroxythreonine-4-phosphate dehydrogenase PdxA [Legionella sp. km772]RUR12444.1 4-hydroxythreonine-4-phosphate dehydrogenase PdxA [Legionella sp. km772]
MKPLLISSGEPAGVGPDLCLALAVHGFPLVVLGDKKVLQERAKLLNLNVKILDYLPETYLEFKPNQLYVSSVLCPKAVQPGKLDPDNGLYVLELLNKAALLCEQQQFSALVTAPVHKANINAAGVSFTGHTEFFADYFQAKQVVMMLACEQMKVALVTTHLPLNKVATTLSFSLITQVISQLNKSLINDFAINKPLIKVAGLNPHAGESGYLGREEIDIIEPALKHLQDLGVHVQGPYPADTMFVKGETACDAYVAMYHDQGLPVLKYAGFNHSVNITLGLPIIRTSVDHGTALDLAGTGKVDTGSMIVAVRTAMQMADNRK